MATQDLEKRLAKKQKKATAKAIRKTTKAQGKAAVAKVEGYGSVKEKRQTTAGNIAKVRSSKKVKNPKRVSTSTSIDNSNRSINTSSGASSNQSQSQNQKQKQNTGGKRRPVATKQTPRKQTPRKQTPRKRPEVETRTQDPTPREGRRKEPIRGSLIQIKDGEVEKKEE